MLQSGKVVIIGALASALLTGCKSTPPPTPIGQSAMRAFESKDWESAVQKFTQAIAQDGARYNYHFNRGICYKMMGRDKEAIADFLDAKSIRPNDNGQALTEVASLYLKNEEFGEAIKYADKILADEDENEKALKIRKSALFGRLQQSVAAGLYEKALSDVGELLKGDPESISYKLVKAKCLFNTNKSPEARSQTEEYLLALQKELDKNSLEWKNTLRLRALNLFHTRTPQSVRQARKVFDQYLDSKKGEGMSSDDAFWAGLIAKVCLDEKKGDEYWSKLGKSYLEKRKKELRQSK